MKKKITLNALLDKTLVKDILGFLVVYHGFDKDWETKTTFLNIANELRIDLDERENWKKLKLHLFFMQEEGLIEERHLKNGLVDYAIEESGILLLKKLK